MDDIGKCFRILGVEPGAGPKAVKKAYRDLVKLWHPDLVQGSAEKKHEAEEKIKQINLAFERIQELRPNDLMALRLSQMASRPSPASAAPSRSPSRPKPRPKAEPSPASPRGGPAEFRPSGGAPKEPATSATAAASESASGGQPFVGSLRVAGAILAFVVLGVGMGILFASRRTPPASDSLVTKSVSMADLDRMIMQSRSGNGASSVNSDSVQSAASVIANLANSTGADAVGRAGFAGVRGASDLAFPVAARSASPGDPLFEPTPGNDLVSSSTNAAVSAAAEEHFRLGRRYATGEEGFEDFAEAVKWYRAAAEAGHPEAQRNLGLLFAAGKGVPQDFAEAEKWLQKASARGQSGAELAGAIIALAKGHPLAGSTNPSDSEFPRTPSGDAKIEDGETLYARALRHSRGEGVPQDLAEAAKWYRLAAEAGHAGAQKNLGVFYATGQGVSKDEVEAQKWLKRAAAQGQAGADLASTLLNLRKSLSPAQSVTNQPGEKSGNRGDTIPAFPLK